MRNKSHCNSRVTQNTYFSLSTSPPPTRAISQWARSLEWRHAVTLHILVGKNCISYFLFYCEGMLFLVVLWHCVPDIVLNSENLNYVNVVRHLGVEVDKRLRFNDNMSYTETNCPKIYGLCINYEIMFRSLFYLGCIILSYILIWIIVYLFGEIHLKHLKLRVFLLCSVHGILVACLFLHYKLHLFFIVRSSVWCC